LTGGLFSGGQSEELVSTPAVNADEYGNATVAWQTGEALMADRNRTVMMKRIDQLVGLPPAIFKSLYEDTVIRFANYCQLMPASENHHHCRLGGLLDHSLDVAERALCIRRGYLLPPNRAPEVVARESDRWTYGVFMAALFHDVGKPAMDLDVSIYDRAGRSLGRWKPSAGPMNDLARYYIRFRSDRLYEQHERIASFIGRILLPDTALNWISEDHDLMSTLLAALAGDFDHAGILGTIVSQADGQSVAADLGSGHGARVSSTNKRPLSDMLLMALKQLFEDGRFQINRPGAEAWVTETDLWLVSKLGADRMREWLIGQGIKAVPSSNLRLFDELQQYQICISTSEDKAVWSVRVEMGEFRPGLTMLRFPIEKIWPDPDRRPAAFEGKIIPQSGKPRTDDQEAEKRAGPAVVEDVDKRATQPVVLLDDLTIGDEVDELSVIEPPLEEPIEIDRDVTQATSTTVEKAVPSGRVVWQDVSQNFLEWLAQGILEDRLKINTLSAMLWSVHEGLFMRTPDIYRAFADQRGIDHVSLRKAVQHRDILMLNQRQPPTNRLHYELAINNGKSRRLKGQVILNPKEVLGIFIPAVPEGIKLGRSKEGLI